MTQQPSQDHPSLQHDLDIIDIDSPSLAPFSTLPTDIHIPLNTDGSIPIPPASVTPSPGWTSHDINVLRLSLIRHGIGSWTNIIQEGCLPGKSISQICLMVQRLLGQQSIAEFQGLHIDPLVIGSINSSKQGPDIKRKNGVIINTGGKLTKQEIQRRLLHNKTQYEVPEHVWKQIVLPKPVYQDTVCSRDELIAMKKDELKEVDAEIQRIQEEIRVVSMRLREKKLKLVDYDEQCSSNAVVEADEEINIEDV